MYIFTLTKGAAPGAGDRQNVPAMGHFIGGCEDLGFEGAGGGSAATAGAAGAGALAGGNCC